MVKMAEVLKKVKKRQGADSLNRVGDMKMRQHTVSRFSSGSLVLDQALGGGWPRGRIIEILGEESSGKTSITLHAIAEIQKLNEKACFVDVEHALDESWAINLGVNYEDLYLSQPDTGEQALEIVLAVVEAEDVPLIVIDSVSALVPRAEIEGEMGDSHMGLQARLMGQAMRKLVGRVAKTNTTVIFINQIRYKIGVVFGDPRTTSGGQALKFYSAIRLEVTRGSQIKENTDVIGNKIKLYTMKNKTAPPAKKKEIYFYYQGGIRIDTELAQLMLETGVIYKNGAFYTLPAKDDFDALLNGDTESLTLKDLMTDKPDIERNKVRGYSEVLKAIRQNTNTQELSKQVLVKQGVI